MNAGTYTAIIATEAGEGSPLSPMETNIIGGITVGIIVLIVVLSLIQARRR